MIKLTSLFETAVFLVTTTITTTTSEQQQQQQQFSYFYLQVTLKVLQFFMYKWILAI